MLSMILLIPGGLALSSLFWAISAAPAPERGDTHGDSVFKKEKEKKRGILWCQVHKHQAHAGRLNNFLRPNSVCFEKLAFGLVMGK